MFEDPANRGGADPVAELEQFALHALISPGRQPSHDLLDRCDAVDVLAAEPIAVSGDQHDRLDLGQAIHDRVRAVVRRTARPHRADGGASVG
jgi:hypothetical protein